MRSPSLRIVWLALRPRVDIPPDDASVFGIGGDSQVCPVLAGQDDRCTADLALDMVRAPRRKLMICMAARRTRGRAEERVPIGQVL